MEPGPSRWVLWLWAGAMIVVGAYYAVTGGVLQLPIIASYSVQPLMLFWALTGAGEIVDATVSRRRGWGARLASSLLTTTSFIGLDLIFLWIVGGDLGDDWRVLDPFVGAVILPIALIMGLVPLPAAAVNVRQAVACRDPRLMDILFALAALHCLPVLWAIILVAAPSIKTIDTRVVAGGVVTMGFVIALLLRADGRERAGAMRQQSSR